MRSVAASWHRPAVPWDRLSAGPQIRETPETGLYAGLIAVALLFLLLAVLAHALDPGPVPAPREALAPAAAPVAPELPATGVLAEVAEE